MFQFPSFASYTYVFSAWWPDLTLAGFPHSESSGSKHVSCSPKIIAAFRVLLRLLMPRHPPSALSSLAIKLVTTKFSAFVQTKLKIFRSLYLLLFNYQRSVSVWLCHTAALLYKRPSLKAQSCQLRTPKLTTFNLYASLCFRFYDLTPKT